MSVTSRTVLVTGGAGYLGRITAELLGQNGYQAILLDNFSTGHRDCVQGLPYFEVELTHLSEVETIFSKVGSVHAVVHFAAKALVPESVADPALYFRNNLLATLNIAEMCVRFRVPHVLHSSSCSVYGIPSEIPIRETSVPAPITPYGESKLLAERMLGQYRRHKGLNALNLRYFNPGGAVGHFGERHVPETHLVPKIVQAFLNNEPIVIYGDDYETPDGTCIRDFLHVADLAEAHVCALAWMEKNPTSPIEVLNLGAGKGASVKSVIRQAEKLFGKAIPLVVEPRRAGDPPVLVADISRATALLGWTPQHSLEDILSDHLRWEKGQKGT
jgi:UDP-glucose-4-epimerase GalE